MTSLGESNVGVPLVQCQIKQYWIHGVEVSEDAWRDKLCCYRCVSFEFSLKV